MITNAFAMDFTLNRQLINFPMKPPDLAGFHRWDVFLLYKSQSAHPYDQKEIYFFKSFQYVHNNKNDSNSRTSGIESLAQNMKSTTEEGKRTPFELSFLGTKESYITSSSVCDRGSRVYFGLKGGLLEECTVNKNGEEVLCSVVARKPLYVQV